PPRGWAPACATCSPPAPGGSGRPASAAAGPRAARTARRRLPAGVRAGGGADRWVRWLRAGPRWSRRHCPRWPPDRPGTGRPGGGPAAARRRPGGAAAGPVSPGGGPAGGSVVPVRRTPAASLQPVADPLAHGRHGEPARVHLPRLPLPVPDHRAVVPAAVAAHRGGGSLDGLQLRRRPGILAVAQVLALEAVE